MLTAEAFNAQQAQALAAIQATAAAHRHGDAYTVSLMQKVTQYVKSVLTQYGITHYALEGALDGRVGNLILYSSPPFCFH